jgi:Domain of unknown function (DUF4214)
VIERISADYAVEFITQLYRIFFDRKPAEVGLQHYLSRLHDDAPPHDIVESFLQSGEFQTFWRQTNLPARA